MAAVFDYGVIVTTATTQNQEILSHTATGTDTTILFMFLGSAFSAWSATEAYIGFGRIQFDTGSGWETKDRLPMFVNTDLDNNCPLCVRPLMSGHVLSVGHKVRGVCTPASVTSMRWKFGVWGSK